MSRFKKIKRKKPKLSKADFLECEDIAHVIALVEIYRHERPGKKISIDQAYSELEAKGILKVR